MDIKLIFKKQTLLSIFLTFFVFNLTVNNYVSPNSLVSTGKSEFYASNVISPFSIIVLPDTQFYSKYYPEIFKSQIQWIIENKESKNIVFVTHLGDLVDNWWSIEEWDNANRSMSKLDGVVPFGVLPGNHDGVGANISNYNDYFGVNRFNNENWYGGAYQNVNSNSYQLFSAGGDDYLIFHIQFNPNDSVLAWVGEIIDSYPSRSVIISTHEYLESWWSGIGSRSEIGNRIWEGLVKLYSDQIFLVLCGHSHDEVRITELVDGNYVHQLLSDYQDRSMGGNGWLRIIEFSSGIDEITVKTYSPFLDKYETDWNSQFILDEEITGIDFSLPVSIILVWILISVVIALVVSYILIRKPFKTRSQVDLSVL